MKLLAVGIALGFLIALGGDVLRARATWRRAAAAPVQRRDVPRRQAALTRRRIRAARRGHRARAARIRRRRRASRAHRRCAARPGRRARSVLLLSRRRGIRRPARQHRGHLRRHRHRSVDRGSRAARGAAVPRFAGRRRRHPQRRHDLRRSTARRWAADLDARHGAHARAARLHREARGRCAPARRCRSSSPWSARRWTCTASPMVPLDGGYRIHAHHDVQRHHRRGFRHRHRAPAPRSAARSRAASIIDLRNNPGGVLESAVEVADQLLETGVIVTADGRTPAARFSMEATPGDVLPGVPVVVLVNGGTASAAEILAGALQDHHRAVLLGRRTFGKGSVQTVMPLVGGPRHQAHDLALLHAVGPLDPGPRHRSRPVVREHRRAAARPRRRARARHARRRATPACAPRSTCSRGASREPPAGMTASARARRSAMTLTHGADPLVRRPRPASRPAPGRAAARLRLLGLPASCSRSCSRRPASWSRRSCPATRCCSPPARWPRWTPAAR